MSRFAKIRHINTYKKVHYYSILFEEEENSIFEQFLSKYVEIEEAKQDLVEMLEWIRKIGDEIGAKSKYFRHEGATSDAKALPPPTKFIEGTAGNLRLYCLVANEQVVFLFNGGIKTTSKAQDCPNVSGYFRLANKISKELNQCFMDKDIRWTNDDTDIEFDEDLEIPI